MERITEGEREGEREGGREGGRERERESVLIQGRGWREGAREAGDSPSRAPRLGNPRLLWRKGHFQALMPAR